MGFIEVIDIDKCVTLFEHDMSHQQGDKLWGIHL